MYVSSLHTKRVRNDLFLIWEEPEQLQDHCVLLHLGLTVFELFKDVYGTSI